MKNAKIVLVVLSIIASCRPTWSQPIFVPQTSHRELVNVCINVSKSQQQKVIDGVNAWGESLKNWKKFVPVIGGGDYCDYFINEIDPPDDIKTTILARTSSLGGKYIYMYRGRYEVDPLTITLHEIGHALGARHMSGTLMAPHIIYNYYRCPDASTVAQVSIMNDIDPGMLTWCDSSKYVALKHDQEILNLNNVVEEWDDDYEGCDHEDKIK